MGSHRVRQQNGAHALVVGRVSPVHGGRASTASLAFPGMGCRHERVWVRPRPPSPASAFLDGCHLERKPVKGRACPIPSRWGECTQPFGPTVRWAIGRPVTLPEVERGNCVPPAFDDFVREELPSLLARGCIAPWSEVRGLTGSERPRMRKALSVEVNKPRLIYDARPLNKLIRAIPFSMDGVETVGQIVAEGGFMTSLDDSSAFHHICLHPASWTLFGFSYEGVDYCFRVLPFGFNASPWVYHTLGDAKAAFLRSREIPALAYLDDALLSNFVAT